MKTAGIKTGVIALCFTYNAGSRWAWSGTQPKQYSQHYVNLPQSVAISHFYQGLQMLFESFHSRGEYAKSKACYR